MTSRSRAAAFAACIASVVGACSAGERRPGAGDSVAGWYLEQDGRPAFQPCSADAPLAVAPSAELVRRARAFGLEPDTPVYVRLQGAVRDDTFDVAAVEQFGSPTPIRDCPMNGVVTRDP
jgi:hypothetical protein